MDALADTCGVRVIDHYKLDITDDGFLSLMTEGGDTKDDVKIPDNEVGEKITKLFKTEEKDTSEFSATQNSKPF